jgi:hypothetical protein
MSPVAAGTGHARPVSARAFRAFQATRPDGGRWELIAGRPVMRAPRPWLTTGSPGIRNAF